jgi:hypothetical protein
MRRLVARCAAVLACTLPLGLLPVALPVLGAGTASAQLAQPNVVSANPMDGTPALPLDVHNTAVYAYAQVGSTMYAGGQFTSINGVRRFNVVAFDATTGALTSFAPRVNGAVWGIAPSADGKLFIGGAFTSVNGVARRR